MTESNKRNGMNYYRVTFDTKKGGYMHWVIDVEATSAKWAQLEAESKWYGKEPEIHMFHIKVRRIKDAEEFVYHWFTEPSEKQEQWVAKINAENANA